MKTLSRICGAVAFTCWVSLCIAAATGHMQIDTLDYCIAVGLLAFQSLCVIIRGV
jgi:hypothetical protein